MRSRAGPLAAETILSQITDRTEIYWAKTRGIWRGVLLWWPLSIESRDLR